MNRIPPLILDSRVITYSLTQLANVPIERHVKVIGKASLGASRLRAYWQQRQPRQGRTYWAKGFKVAKGGTDRVESLLRPSLRNRQ